MAGKQPGSNEMAALVGPVWSEARAGDALGVTREGLAAWCSAGGVLRLVTADGEAVYPVWQFHQRDGTVEVKPALVPFLRALRAFDPWTVAVILHTPAPELDDTTPLDWLAEGHDASALAALAGVVAREWSAGTPVV